MVVGESVLKPSRAWWSNDRSQALRAAAVVLGVAVVWWVAALALSPTAWYGLIGYSVAQAALIVYGRGQSRLAVRSMWLAAGVDVLFGLLLLSLAPSLGVGIYPLYLLVAMRALSVYSRTPAVTIIPFALGPLYLFAQMLSRQSVTMSGADQGAAWLLMAGSLGFGVVAIWSSAFQQRARAVLDDELREARHAADDRVILLERTASDLRARMRERHALEEGLKAITSTLSLDEVLSQIIDSTLQMLGPARVHGIVLSLSSGETFAHRALLLDPEENAPWADMLARRAMQQRVPLIVSDVAHDEAFAAAMPPHIRSALSVPLFVGDDEPRGALSVISTTQVTFSSSDARNMTAFAIQAGIAIGNAELHSQIRRQQRLLEAVVRDISDGLVVVDSAGRVVLSNPLGRELLDCTTAQMSVRDQVLSLAQSIHAADKATLMSVIKVDGDENAGMEERHYQAIGSLVRRTHTDEPLIAIVLHDISAQKAEEHSRAQFISMVAHELRNPLNSLNGFLKIVLQGKAGSLSDMQLEFLQIADSQVDLLKGRISELLEYNRVEAGKLNLAPAWNDLSLLVTGAASRLSYAAEQVGLTLYNEVDDNLPEWYFDGERVGQVLTNLVENAIKATPPGGEIRIQSEVQDDEIWIRVCDTGVGIPLEEQRKIFEPFVQGTMGTTRKNHLGLGLAICKQIIEGHQGRLWVESEPGRGTRFTFALPRVEREMTVGV